MDGVRICRVMIGLVPFHVNEPSDDLHIKALMILQYITAVCHIVLDTLVI